jgi:repressor LexA
MHFREKFYPKKMEHLFAFCCEMCYDGNANICASVAGIDDPKAFPSMGRLILNKIKEGPDMTQLSPKQQKIYEYILSYTQSNGYPPSVREIAAAVGLKSPSTVHFHLTRLEEAGVISRGAGKTRAITAVHTIDDDMPHRDENRIPVLGNVAAGAPILAEEMIEEYIPFDNGEDCYALRIRGESMINAGILPGDLVIVRQQNTAVNGDIVIALIGDEATCKRFSRKDGHIWLLPENDDYEPIDGTFCRILGRVIGLQRYY